MTPRPARYDVVVVGGGPAGATAAGELASAGRGVLLVDRAGRIKPCGGAIPTRLIDEFDIPHSMLKARIRSARIFAPSGRSVDMAIDGGFVGMVDREVFDPWLRQRAEARGTELVAARFETACPAEDGGVEIAVAGADGISRTIHARAVIGADGANSAVGRAMFGAAARSPYVFAYHEIVRSPLGRHVSFEPQRCDVHYRSEVSPDFYGWVFPHGETISVGVGSAVKGFDLRKAARTLCEEAALQDREVIRREGAPLPLKPLRRWDNGRDTVLIGDAAGVVAPSSGEGIYYAMLSGRLAAEAVHAFLATGNVAELARPRRRFMRQHGLIFAMLGFMQGFWYRNDKRRERFVAICQDRDVQRLVWESYLSKRLAYADPLTHMRVVAKDIGHVVRMAFS
ncbi:MAG: geranylgeranyl diphosphate reductase [Rhizobiaceae bacterium]|nr:geranylgeranyl diphosphate reductase [Rhizobiaceae bacterium]